MQRQTSKTLLLCCEKLVNFVVFIGVSFAGISNSRSRSCDRETSSLERCNLQPLTIIKKQQILMTVRHFLR
ncbi:hypothetical protein CKA32_000750 [Geitlerinema sp. FC II]|nr:hypothetical protein CKA32_000750 [Geitlerinema sp. FC II]